MQRSLRRQLRWRLQDLRNLEDGKLLAGLLVVVGLTLGGFLVARTLARASAEPQAATQTVTLRRGVWVGRHGGVVTRESARRLYSKGQTVMRTQTIQTPQGVRVVTHPVVGARVVYRKSVVTRPNGIRTVTREVTDSRVVTQQVTTATTTTVVSTRTETLPIRVTVPLP